MDETTFTNLCQTHNDMETIIQAIDNHALEVMFCGIFTYCDFKIIIYFIKKLRESRDILRNDRYLFDNMLRNNVLLDSEKIKVIEAYMGVVVNAYRFNCVVKYFTPDEIPRFIDISNICEFCNIEIIMQAIAKRNEFETDIFSQILRNLNLTFIEKINVAKNIKLFSIKLFESKVTRKFAKDILEKYYDESIEYVANELVEHNLCEKLGIYKKADNKPFPIMIKLSKNKFIAWKLLEFIIFSI